MKRFMLALSVLVMALTASLFSPTYVSAETSESILNSTYNYLMTNPLEQVEETEIAEYALKVENGIILAESINANEELKASIENFSVKHALILKKYKFFVSDYKLELLYKPEDYSNTENGVIKLNNEKASVKLAIENATNKQQVDEAYSTFYELVNSNTLSKNVNFAKTNEEGVIYGEVTTVDGSLYFAEDDSLIISKYNNSAIIKNAQVALLENEDLLMENGGIAYYFNVQLSKGGVLVEELSTPILLKIKLEDVGLTLNNDAVVQIAVYNGNRSVTLKPATVQDGYLVFEIAELGEYALCLEGYAIKGRSAVVIFFKDYGVYVLLGLLVIFLIIVPIQYSRKLKRKKLKAEKKEFKRFKKAKKLENKNLKKQKKQKRKR